MRSVPPWLTRSTGHVSLAATSVEDRPDALGGLGNRLAPRRPVPGRRPPGSIALAVDRRQLGVGPSLPLAGADLDEPRVGLRLNADRSADDGGGLGGARQGRGEDPRRTQVRVGGEPVRHHLRLATAALREWRVEPPLPSAFAFQSVTP